MPGKPPLAALLCCTLALITAAALAACGALPSLSPSPTPPPPTDPSPTSPPATATPTEPPTPTPLPTPTAISTGAVIGQENIAGLRILHSGGEGALASIAVNPAGDLIAAAGDAGVWLIDKFSLEPQAVLRLHAGAVNAVSWSADGSRLASAGADGTVRIWELDGADAVQTALLVGHSGAVQALAWSPDGLRLASGGEDQAVQIWDAARLQRSASFFHTSAITSLDWHPNSAWLLVGEFDGSLSVEDAASGEALASFAAQDGWVQAVRWSPDGAQAASGGLDQAVRLWTVSESANGSLDFSLQSEIPTRYAIEALAWAPDGSALAASGGIPYTVELLNPAPAEGAPALLLDLEGHTAPITGLAFAPGGVLLTVSLDNTLRAWDLKTARELRRLDSASGHAFTGALNAADWSPESDRLATGGSDGTLRIWPVEGGDPVAVPAHQGPVNALDWSPGGAWIATAGNDNATRLWDAAAGTLIQELTSEGGRINAVAFAPFGNQLAAGGFFRIVQVFEAGTDVQPLLLYPDVEITALAWSGSGTLLAVGGNDGSVHIFDVPAAAEIGVLSGEHSTPITGIAWEPGGSRIAAMDGRGTIAVWDSATGALEQSRPGAGGTWAGFAWSARGLLTAGNDSGMVYFWDHATLEPTAVFAGHGAPVNDVRFSDDGQFVVSADAGGRWAVWEPDPAVVEQLVLAPPEEGGPGSLLPAGWPPITPLTAETARQAVQTAVIGRGTAAVYDGAGEYVAVGGGAGVWIYERDVRRPLRYLEGGRAFGVRWSPDGRLLAVRELQLLRIWDVDAAQVLRAIPLGLGTADALAWSPDGRMAAAGDRQGNVVVINLATGRTVRSWNAGAEVAALDWSPDGRLLAAAAGNEILLWDLPSGEQAALLSGHTDLVQVIAFHPTEPLLLSGSSEPSLRIWALDTIVPPEAPLNEEDEIVWPEVAADALPLVTVMETTGVAWSADGGVFFSEHGCCAVFEWGLATRAIQARVETDADSGASATRLLRDGTTIIAFGPLDGHLPAQAGIQWLSAAKTLLPNLAMLGADGQLRVMDLEPFTWNPFYEFFNRQGSVLNLVPGSPILTVRQLTDQPMIAQFLPDEDFERATGVPFGLMAEPAENWVGAAAPDGNAVAWTDTGTWPQRLITLDLQTAMTLTIGLLESETETDEPLANALAWAPDQSRIAAGLKDGTLLVFTTDSPRRVLENRIFDVSINALAWSPDGTVIAAAGSDGQGNGGQQVIRLVRVSDGRVLQELALDFGQTATVLAFSSDGSLLASGDSAGDVQIWDSASGIRLADLEGHKLAVTGIAFSPDGIALATSSRDGTVRIWGLEQ